MIAYEEDEAAENSLKKLQDYKLFELLLNLVDIRLKYKNIFIR
jgi:hypothetical protein